MSQTQAHSLEGGFPLDGLKLWHLLQTQISGEGLKVNSINFDGNIHTSHNMQQEINLYNEEHRLKMNQAQLQHQHHHSHQNNNHHHQDKVPCNCAMCPPQDKKSNNNNNNNNMNHHHNNQIHAHSHQILHQPNQQALAKHTHPTSHLQHVVVVPSSASSSNLSCSVCHKKIRNSKKQQQQAHSLMCDKCSRSQKNLYNQNNIQGNSQNNNNANTNNNAHNSVYSHSTITTHTTNSHAAGGEYERNKNRSNTGDKNFSCPKCSKTFSNGGNLKRHGMIHDGQKPFSCHVCNKAFRSKTLLINHQRTHSGEKPFHCALCDKKFSKSENLKRHVKIHVKSM